MACGLVGCHRKWRRKSPCRFSNDPASATVLSSFKSSHVGRQARNNCRTLGNSQTIAKPRLKSIRALTVFKWANGSGIENIIQSCLAAYGPRIPSNKVGTATPFIPAMPRSIVIADETLSARKNTQPITTAKNVSAPAPRVVSRPPSPQPMRRLP